MNKKVFLLILIIIGVVAYVWFYPPNDPTKPLVDNKQVKEAGTFEECAAQGFPIRESYPPTCVTKSGKILTQNIGNELAMTDQINIKYPRPTQKVTTPQKIEGQARGNWFFEGQFTAKMLNAKGEVIGEGVMKAQGEWTTKEFVPYSGVVEFNPKNDINGKLVLEKANPSGIGEKDSQLIVVVKFR